MRMINPIKPHCYIFLLLLEIFLLAHLIGQKTLDGLCINPKRQVYPGLKRRFIDFIFVSCLNGVALLPLFCVPFVHFSFSFDYFPQH